MKLSFKLKKKNKPKDIAHFSYASINPFRDWYIILNIFFLFLFLSLIWSVYFFFAMKNYQAENPVVSSGNKDTALITQLQKVVDQYSSQSAAYQNFQNQKPEISDPSL